MKKQKTGILKSLLGFTLMYVLSLSSTFAQTTDVIIHGSIIASEALNEHQVGLYSFTAGPEPYFTPVKITPEIVAQGGGVYAENKYYSIHIDDSMNKILYIFDAETWDIIESRPMSNATLDMAYDPTTQKIYGCFVDNGAKLGTLEPEKGSYQYISNLSMPLSTLVCTAEGQLYGIAADGILYQINKENGEMTQVGPTNVSPMFAQSATIDPTSGKCYWASTSPDYTSGLYEVNLKTGNATLITSYPNEEEITGLFILPRPNENAPAKVTDFVTDFGEGNTTGQISFTMPDISYSGFALTGELSYEVTANDQKWTGTKKAGEFVSMNLSLTTGKYKFTVTTTNSYGTSEKFVTSQWIGKDAPTSVTELTVKKASASNIKLTWNAPQTGQNNGYINPQQLTYKIIRHPEAVTVQNNYQGTSFTEILEPAELTSYWYEVIPVYEEKSGESSISNKVVVGPGKEIPYTEDFQSEDSFSFFTVSDENKDNITWIYDNFTYTAYYGGTAPQQTDDWLITPPIRLNKSDFYRLSFTLKCNSYDTHSLEVYSGELPDINNMNVQLIETTEIATQFGEKELEAKFYVPEDKDVYIGFHLLSAIGAASFELDNISLVRLSSVDAPDAVTDLKVTPADKGLLQASVSFNLPVKTINGNKLNLIKKATLFRNDTLIHEYTSDLEPGKQLSFEDKLTASAFYSYKVITENEHGISNDISVKKYIGIDKPAAVTDIVLEETEDGIVSITWKAPQIGMNGGYINPDSLKYSVARNGWMEVEPNRTGLTRTDSIKDLSNEQRNIYYCITAESASGKGITSNSDYIMVGKPYQLPFKESFSTGIATYKEWVSFPIMSPSAWWVFSFPNSDTQDGDLGMVTFSTMEEISGLTRLMSPKIGIQDSKKPKLKFWYYHSMMENTMTLEIYDSNLEKRVTHTLDLSSQPDSWIECELDLQEFKNEPFIQLGFSVEGVAKNNVIYIDNIRVYDDLKHNLSLTGMEGPIKAVTGKETTVYAKITNYGSYKASDYTVDFYNGDCLLTSVQGQEILPDASIKIQATFVPEIKDLYSMNIYAIINYELDENQENNKGDIITIPLAPPSYPTVDDLRGESQSSDIILQWSAPDLTNLQPESVVEDFEKYESFTISDLGEWTLVDVDKHQRTMEFSNSKNEYVTYPNSGGAMSFQLIDLSQIDKLTPADGWSSVSGDKILICPYSQLNSDNWLISPELYTGKQTIKIYAKSLNQNFYGLEKFTVLYSTTDKQLSSFTKLETKTDIPMEWTKYTFNLPEGCKYFAIQATDTNSALFLDDITFIPATAEIPQMNIEGYHIYRDGKKLTEKPIAETTYTDSSLEINGDYTYAVTVVYSLGESDYSNKTTLSYQTDIDTEDTETIQIITRSNELEIINKLLLPIRLFTIEGKLIYSSTKEERLILSVNSGCYILKTPESTMKVMIP